MDKYNFQHVPMTLEIISQLKSEKQEEMRKSKERMASLANQIFAPVQPRNGIDAFMQNISSGIAIYDGVLTGVKIIRRIRSFFLHKKRA